MQSTTNARVSRVIGKEQEEIPLPKTHFKRLELENSSVLKMYRQQNATHVGDRENATSVMCNLDYDMIGKQRYRYSMRIEEPTFDIEQGLLVKLGQAPTIAKEKP